MFDKIYKLISNDIGIDLGTSNTLVYLKGHGIVINEPSVVAVNIKTNQILAVGEKAKEMLGRTPGHIKAVRPLVDGVISDFEVTEEMLSYLINKADKMWPKLAHPRVVVGVPSGTTNVESRAVYDASRSAGAREVYLVEEPMAAAIGIRLPVKEPIGSMIIDIGGGTTDIAVISLGGIVASTSVRIGGNRFDTAIAEFIRRKYNLAIGERTAERIKIDIGSAMYMEERLTEEVRGRDMVSGLPKTVTVNSDDITDAISGELEGIIQAVKDVLHKTPPELSADVIDKGIIMSGGSSLLRNIDQLITQVTGVSAYVAEEPLFCVAKGTGIALENLESYKRSILAIK